MKNNLVNILVISVFVFVFVPTVSADYHRAGFTLDGGYSTVIHPQSSVRSGGMATSLGGVYEFQHRHFLLHTGLSAQYSLLAFHLPSTTADVPDMIDEDGDVATLHYKIAAFNAGDHLLTPRVSLMAGGDWDHIYFLMGANVGADVLHRSVYSTTYSVSASYPFFDQEAQDMPQHGLVSDLSHAAELKQPVIFDAQAAFEIGTSFRTSGRSNAPMIRLGLFGEYVIPLSSQSSFVVDRSLYRGVAYEQLGQEVLARFDQSMSSYLQHGQWGRFTVGVRLAVLFNIKKTSTYRCVICEH